MMEEIELANGYTFQGIPANRDGEIMGHVIKPEGGIFGYAGWYRTSNVYLAASLAAGNLASDGFITWDQYREIDNRVMDQG